MVATHIYTPNSTPRELPSPCSRLLFVSLMIANPTGVKGNSSGVLASMSLKDKNIEYFFVQIFTGHLYFFLREMSVQVTYAFIDWVVQCLFFGVLYKF